VQIRGEDSGDTFKIVCLCNKSNEPSGLPNVVMLPWSEYGTPALRIHCPNCNETKTYKLTHLQGWQAQA